MLKQRCATFCEVTFSDKSELRLHAKIPIRILGHIWHILTICFVFSHGYLVWSSLIFYSEQTLILLSETLTGIIIKDFQVCLKKLPKLSNAKPSSNGNWFYILLIVLFFKAFLCLPAENDCRHCFCKVDKV